MPELSEAQKRVLWFMLEGEFECLFINREEVGQYRINGMRPTYVDTLPRYSVVIDLEKLGLVSCDGPIARREWFSLTDSGRERAKELREQDVTTNLN